MSNEGQKRTTVLFVDDDRSYRETLGNLFETWGGNGYEVRLAGSVAEGLTILNEAPVELVVTDLQMPVVDGLQFVQLLQRKYPRLPKVVLTSRTDETARDACVQAGADLFLNKPTDIRLMEEIFANLKALIGVQAPEGFRGVMRQVGLAELIQLECLGYKSSVLEVSDHSAAGGIVIRDGRIIHATFGKLAGVEALNHMLSLSGGNFALKAFQPPVAETISDSWEMLLMEAARLRDEAAEAAAQAKATPLPEPLVIPELPDDPKGPETIEMLIASVKGEVIYDWKTPDAEARMEWFARVRQAAQRLNRKLPLGRLMAFEMVDGPERTVARMNDDWTALVRTNHDAKG